jgi:hypothetical protein
MNPENASDVRFDSVLDAFGTDAIAEILFARDVKDDFSIEVNVLQSSLGATLGKTDVFSLLPKGSRWIQAVGWRSYFGLPLTTRASQCLCLGGQWVVPHPSRGAVPQFRGYVYPLDKPKEQTIMSIRASFCPPQRALERALQAMAVDLDSVPAISTPGILDAHSTSPRDHYSIEARILRTAAERYGRGERFSFRTVVQSEGDLEEVRQRSGWLGKGDGTFLMATVPAIKRSFGAPVQRWLESNRIDSDES